ncbi:MAG: SRPBCC family protein [Armatimonadetes bacterium]|nr:SRPBCC family protein [Armatimonadota bacterium]
MPKIELTVHIDAPIERVYAIAKDVESFPEFMPDVKSLKVLERSDDGARTVTEWAGYVPQFRLTVKWTEEDVWDDAARVCKFRQLKGDYDRMEGEWQFISNGSGCAFTSILDYDFSVPLLGPIVQRVVQHLVKQNLQGILDGIKQRAESKASVG